MALNTGRNVYGRSPRWRRRSNLAIRSAAMFPFLTVPSMASARQDEPNDTVSTATTTGLIGVGSVVLEDALLGNGHWLERDVDVYSFEVLESTPVTALVEVTADSPELDAFLRLFDPNGNEFTNNDDRSFTSTDSRFQTHLIRGGVYYIGVSTAANPHYDSSVAGGGRPGVGGVYALSLSTEATTIPESSIEPNDQVFSATFMGEESFQVKGEFIGNGPHGRRDVDIYKLYLTGPARIDAEVRADAIGSLLDPVLRLRNCEDSTEDPTYVDRCLLGAADDAPDGSADSAVSVGVVVPQEVYIMVSGAGNRRFDPTIPGSGEPGSVGTYDLIVNVSYFDIGDPSEPGDSILLARHLSPFVSGRPETVVLDEFVGDGRYGRLQGDRDFFEVTILDKARMLTVDVAAESIGSDLDPVVVVFDAEGRQVALNDNHGDSTDAHLVLPVECVSIGEDVVSAYVMVMGTKRRPTTSPYVPHADTISVTPDELDDGPGSTGPYRLSLGVGAIADNCINEPDDTLATATETGLVDEGYYVCTHGLLGDALCRNPWEDLDMWSLSIPHPPAVVGVEIMGCSRDLLSEQAIVILDADGAALAWVDGKDYPPQRSLRFVVQDPGTYYVAILEWFVPDWDYHPDRFNFDPFIPCSVEGNSTFGAFDLKITLTGVAGAHAANRASDPAIGVDSPEARLFVTPLDVTSSHIDVIDPNDASLVTSLPAPEPWFGGSEGVAYDGSHLYYVGVGWYPQLYRLDPRNGDILDDYILWMGSGFFTDAVMLGDELFLLDPHQDSVHVLDPFLGRFLRTLHVGRANGVNLAGGLAALAGPNRLYVADAFKTGAVYEIDPQWGRMTNTLTPPMNRPTALAGIGTSRLYVGDWQSDVIDVIDRQGGALHTLALPSPTGSLAGEATVGPFADFDLDGDIDLYDYAAIQRCFTGPGGSLGPDCSAGDRNGDGWIDLEDFGSFPAATTGP